MSTSIRPQMDFSNGMMMHVLNDNIIIDDNKKAEIKAMGLGICNIKCLRTNIGNGKYLSKV